MATVMMLIDRDGNSFRAATDAEIAAAVPGRMPTAPRKITVDGTLYWVTSRPAPTSARGDDAAVAYLSGNERALGCGPEER